jgi:hypothetical protein
LYLDSRKDGLSQRWALANNLAANAADGVQASHDEHNAQLAGNRQVPGQKGAKILQNWHFGTVALASPRRLSGS